MQNSDKAEQIFVMSDTENVWLNKSSEDVWIYRIATNPKYLSKTKLKLVLSILLCVGVIVAGFIVWSLMTALLGALIAIFILPLLEVITVLAYSLVLAGRKEEVITIHRAEGKIKNSYRNRRGGEAENEYKLQDFITVGCSKITSKDKRNPSTYFVVSLHGPSARFEIFCTPDKDAARVHCRELAAFLNLRYDG
jgi:hypothetical protein